MATAYTSQANMEPTMAYGILLPGTIIPATLSVKQAIAVTIGQHLRPAEVPDTQWSLIQTASSLPDHSISPPPCPSAAAGNKYRFAAQWFLQDYANIISASMLSLAAICLACWNVGSFLPLRISQRRGAVIPRIVARSFCDSFISCILY